MVNPPMRTCADHVFTASDGRMCAAAAAISMQLEAGGNLLVQQHLLNALSTACRTRPNATLTPGEAFPHDDWGCRRVPV